MKCYKTVLLFLLSCHYLLGQNLVPNPSFEQYEECPWNYTEYAIKKLIPFWFVPTKGTPDYFNKCGRNGSGIPQNRHGIQFPHSGNGYVGIFLRTSLNENYSSESYRSDNYREYIQTKLIQPLKNDKLYCVRSFVSLAQDSEFAVNSFGIHISKKKIKNRTHSENLNVIPQISVPDSLFLELKTNWISICGIYKALGGEKFITIGNFKTDKQTKIKKNELKKVARKEEKGRGGYYFIDDVSVLEITDSSKCNCKEKTKDSLLAVNQTKPPIDTIALQIGESIILKNLVFETNRSEILPGSFTELNKLTAYLKQYPQYKIELSGHTDNIGKEEDNQKLSEARAKAVAEYLTKNGIAKDRVSYKGYGSSKPLKTNDTEEGRQQNRRVEFVVHE